ncbi:hypothetical protein Dda_0159 [Drechslerella dactyloides]|uniref:Uncharacterized protein n=1 Tax=Drechslerella dactyloides TaxID=74499 RepID=A0AAD6J4B0_DREDA|nr:hypothetical protein Dda_0159 [Drechslerella dactyloides]
MPTLHTRDYFFTPWHTYAAAIIGGIAGIIILILLVRLFFYLNSRPVYQAAPPPVQHPPWWAWRFNKPLYPNYPPQLQQHHFPPPQPQSQPHRWGAGVWGPGGPATARVAQHTHTIPRDHNNSRNTHRSGRRGNGGAGASARMQRPAPAVVRMHVVPPPPPPPQPVNLTLLVLNVDGGNAGGDSNGNAASAGATRQQTEGITRVADRNEAPPAYRP